MNAAACCTAREFAAPPSSMNAQISAFLAGETGGEGPLHALYDDILDEPIPERLLALLRA